MAANVLVVTRSVTTDTTQVAAAKALTPLLTVPALTHLLIAPTIDVVAAAPLTTRGGDEAVA